jgi:multiple sugar transport system ATP-binding protein
MDSLAGIVIESTTGKSGTGSREDGVMAQVAFDGVSKIYPDGTRAVNQIDLDIRDGEFMVLVGPSGCGKTTALRMVAGLEDISEGVLKIGERVVNHVPSRDRDIAMVFQSYALYPHLSVYENIAFGLKLKKMPKDEIERRVQHAAKLLGLEDFLKRKPRALSGGQRQRVAMGRAIVREPQAFLMDEPLSNLDAKLRVQMRAEIAKLQGDLGVTTIYVTHDQVEAMTMGDRVAVMRKGEIQQVDEPQTLYDRPVNLFVGGFIGSPAMNMLDATIARSNGDLKATIGQQSITLGQETLDGRPGLQDYVGKQVIIGIRPEDLEDAALETDAPADRVLRGRLELREALGSEIMAHFAIEAAQAETDETRELARDAGAPAEGRPSIGTQENEAVVVGRFGARSRVKEGEQIAAVVDTRALHFFDRETGNGIYTRVKGETT